MAELDINVRNLGRHPEGYWTGEINDPGTENFWPVHRKYGSWMVGWGDKMADVLPPLAAELQRLVKKLEKAERQNDL